jgi:peptidoglycan/xylan/chitin deacetylase (PgdA/CDA1 family)
MQPWRVQIAAPEPFRPPRQEDAPVGGLARGHRRKYPQSAQVGLSGTTNIRLRVQVRGAAFADHAGRGETLPSDHRFTRLRLELAYFSGLAWLRANATGGAGVILRFERVRPRRSERFQPLRSHEITPKFLDRTIRALKRWKFDIVSMDEVCRRAVTLASPRRFACLTFDGGYRDLMTSAYPLLAEHGVPFTVYLPTAFPDGLGEAWWLALEEVIARENRVSLVMDRKEHRFDIGSTSEKYQLYNFLAGWMRSLPPIELSSAINDLCKRYSVDLAAVSREASMDWAELAKLAADPLVTIGSATVNYPVLSTLKDTAALREMTMGRAVAEAAFRRDVRHFAYPFGEVEGRTNLHALPRIAWDGRQRSLRVMRAMLSGIPFPTARRPRQGP